MYLSEVVRKDFLRAGGDFLRLLLIQGSLPLSAPLPIPAPVTIVSDQQMNREGVVSQEIESDSSRRLHQYWSTL